MIWCDMGFVCLVKQVLQHFIWQLLLVSVGMPLELKHHRNQPKGVSGVNETLVLYSGPVPHMLLAVTVIV